MEKEWERNTIRKQAERIEVELEQGRSYQSHWAHWEQSGVDSHEAGAPGKGVALEGLGGC